MSIGMDPATSAHDHRDACGCRPAWQVDTPGAAGLPIARNEDRAPPPEESHGALFLPDTIEKGCHVGELKDGACWLISGWYDRMLVCTGSGVVAVDAPCSIGERILDAIGGATDEPVTHTIHSHWHGGHVGAARVHRGQVKRYGHRKTVPKPSRARRRWTVPTS